MAQEIIVYLNTPLHHHETKELKDAITKIEGRLLEREDGGVLMKVKSLYGEKNKITLEEPLKVIFIPYYKIDFINICED